MEPNTGKRHSFAWKRPKRVKKLVPSLRNLTNKERLIALDFTNLANRGAGGDMKCSKSWKITSTLNYTHFFKLSTTKTRRQNVKLYKQRNRLRLRQHFFSLRIVKLWKRLPEDILSCSTVLSFEKLYDYDSFHCEGKFNFLGLIGCKPRISLFDILLLL